MGFVQHTAGHPYLPAASAGKHSDVGVVVGAGIEGVGIEGIEVASAGVEDVGAPTSELGAGLLA